MNINEFARTLKSYVESQPSKSENGDAEALLELLFDAYVDFIGFDRETIRKDFHDLYAAMNGKTTQEIDEIIYPVCTLCLIMKRQGFKKVSKSASDWPGKQILHSKEPRQANRSGCPFIVIFLPIIRPHPFLKKWQKGMRSNCFRRIGEFELSSADFLQ